MTPNNTGLKLISQVFLAMWGMWIILRSSLWFIPAVCVVVGAALGWGLVEIDSRWEMELGERWPLFFGLGAEGSRGMLSTIAQSVITIAGVTFSITIVALSLAANQYTPRVLRNFMRDRGNQAVLGALVGIFTYCLIVLRVVRGGDDPFVPAVSVMLALILAVVAIGFFIYFIHHVATTIQASTIICSIATETKETIQTIFPEEQPQEKDQAPPALKGLEWEHVPSPRSGFLQTFDQEAAKKFALKHNLVLRTERIIGDFISEQTPLLSISPLGRQDPHVIRNLHGLFTIQDSRTIEQDPAFGIRQIVDIAVKALSPGINDPTTATTCLAYLSSILLVLVQRSMPPEWEYAPDGKPLLMTRRRTVEGLVELSFQEIRQNSGSQPVVLAGILDALNVVSATERMSPGVRQALLAQRSLVLKTAEQSLKFQPDLDWLRQRATFRSHEPQQMNEAA